MWRILSSLIYVILPGYHFRKDYYLTKLGVEVEIQDKLKPSQKVTLHLNSSELFFMKTSNILYIVKSPFVIKHLIFMNLENLDFY